MIKKEMKDSRISDIYHGGKQPTPPHELDDTILNAARDAVAQEDGKTKHGAASPFDGRIAPLSVAAVVVLAVLVVPLLLQEQPVPPTALEEIVMEDTAPTDSGSRPGTLKRTVDRATIPVSQEKLRSQQDPTADRPAGASQAGPPPAMRALPAPSTANGLMAPAEENAEGGNESARGQPEQDADSLLLQQRREPLPVETNQYNRAEDWMAYIEQLAAQQKIATARRELDRFIDMYPDYAIEPALLESLGLPLRPSMQP